MNWCSCKATCVHGVFPNLKGQVGILPLAIAGVGNMERAVCSASVQSLGSHDM